VAALESRLGLGGQADVLDPEAQHKSTIEAARPALAAQRFGGMAQPIEQTRIVWTVVVCAAIVAAYSYSLVGLFKAVVLLSPTAYVGLVPILGLVLIGVRTLAVDREPRIDDRYTDYAIGLPLIVCALVILFLFPAQASPLFWQRRLDLLSLPLFTSGAIAIVFSVRTLWRARWAIAYLFLGILIPLTPSVERLTGLSASGTDSAVALAVISIKAALGWLIIGLAFASLAQGRLWFKMAWFAAGLTVSEAVTLAVSADGVGLTRDTSSHRLIELSILILAAVLMVGLSPLFKQRFMPQKLTGSHPSKRSRTPLSVVIIAAMLAAVASFSFPKYGAVLTQSGIPRLQAGFMPSVDVADWSIADLGSLAWVTRYYGLGAVGERYGLKCTCADSLVPSAGPSGTVLLDAISSDQELPLSPSELALLHPLHSSDLVSLARIDLGRGVIGRVAVYREAAASDWVAIYWDWPVNASSGNHYQHIVLEASGTIPGKRNQSVASRSVVLGVAMRISDWLDGVPSQPVNQQTMMVRQDLIQVAQSIVAAVSAAAPGVE